MINICKASAGAGKTHKLTGEYIKLLFRKPFAYRNILAVTFTNKATDEMKQRILKELHNLSVSGRKSDYLKDIMELTGKDEVWVRKQAGDILVSILHSYSSFWVTTIDKFFQQVMRSFAKELGKMATYNVELDQKSVLSLAVDRMFSDLDLEQNSSLLEWLIEYSLEAVENGCMWDVKKDIVKLADEIFSEDFKMVKEECLQQGGELSLQGVSDFKKRLQQTVKHFESQLKDMCEQGQKIMSDNGLQAEEFAGKSKSNFKYLNRAELMIKTGKIVPPPFGEQYNNLDEWYSGKKCPPAIEAAYNGGLNDVLGGLLNLFEEGYRSYKTACLVLRNVNVVGILNDIYMRIQEYCREKNVVLLSESTELLNKIIDGSDTPFVYEKIGTRIENFMLDEFQDTSLMQWKNFYPLLCNSISEGNDNLIVGDVKQSIYRWRGSDWSILGSRIYNEFAKGEIDDDELEFNYRSAAPIIEFNNDFFDYCSKACQNIYNGKDEGVIEGIYRGFGQKLPEGKRKQGSVTIDFVDGNKDTFHSDALALLVEKIAEYLERGYRKKDMAVLVRKGSEGNEVAEALLSAGYDIISSDSLFIKMSGAVQKVISLLREVENSPGIELWEGMEEYSLYQLCEGIIRECLTPELRNDVAFLQAFLDLVLEFTNSEGTNLTQFLQWWDEFGVKCTISAPDDMDAIRIMTIHKSKGLGFDVVLIPFLKEKLDHENIFAPNLWCNCNSVPVPVKYSKAMCDTEYAGKYENEKINKFVDSLNTVYVAFTRPKRELYVVAPESHMKKGGSYTVDSVSDLLYAYYRKYKDTRGWKEGIMMGEPSELPAEEESLQKIAVEAPFSHSIVSTASRTVSQQGEIGDGESIREHGIAMHYVFSLVTDYSSIEEAVERAVAEGVSTCGKEELKEMVASKIGSVEEYGWFKEGNTIYNECSILTEEGQERRPDRVIVNGGSATVVDYKFGEYSGDDTWQLNSYKKQVSGYKQLLTRMGYANVQGYIWYISSDKVISV